MRKLLSYALLGSLAFSAAIAADLRDDQSAAVDKILAAMDPAMRDMVRPQLELSIMHLSPQQVEMFVKGASGANPANNAPAPVAEEPERTASPDDLAYNRAQYEPALRQHWDAKKAFDTFVDAELKAKCPDPSKYAVYREAERYDVMELRPTWQRAPDNREAEASIVGSSYAPKDGRYKFDFSQVRMTFDKAIVTNAISKACADWTKEAVAFKAKAGSLMTSGQSQAALDYQGAVANRVSAIAQTLQTVLDVEGPAGNHNTAMMQALMNPTPLK